MLKVPVLSNLAMGLLFLAASAHADVVVTAVINNAAFGNGPIQSWNLDLTTGTATAEGSFVPEGAKPGGVNGADPNGRAIAVTNTEFYYTELSNGFGPVLNIEAGPYNGGAGGPDNGTIANPIPGQGIADLHFGSGPTGGDLYAMAGYPTQGPFVYIFNPVGGAIVAPPVKMQTAADADGFTILPNGNYLINRGDGVNEYDQYNPTTGARIAGTTITAPGCTGSSLNSTGVDTDGTHLFFDCTISGHGIVETDLNGNLIHDFSVPGAFGEGEGLSLVENFTPPPPTVPEPAETIGLLAAGALIAVSKLRRKSA